MVGSHALRRPHAPFASHGTLRLDRDRVVNVHSGEKRLRRAPPIPPRYAVSGGRETGDSPSGELTCTWLVDARPNCVTTAL